MLNTTKKGAIAELTACNWLLNQGYEVFRNLTPTGWIDIIAWKANEDPIFIDVAMCSNKDGRILDPKAWHAKRGVHYNINFIYVFADGTCRWRHDVVKTIENPVKKHCEACNGEMYVKGNAIKKYCSLACYKGAVKKRGKAKYYSRKIENLTS